MFQMDKAKGTADQFPTTSFYHQGNTNIDQNAKSDDENDLDIDELEEVCLSGLSKYCFKWVIWMPIFFNAEVLI